MKNLFIVIAIVFLSCKDASTKNETAEQATSEIMMAEEAKEAESHGLETTSEESDTNTESISNEKGSIDQNYIKSALYRGTLNGTIKIALYLKESENPCGGDLTFFTGMYKYENQDKWILLEISIDRQKKNFCMVENGFSGVLFLEENNGNFTGNWISPNTKKQFKVKLEDELLDIKLAKDHTIIEQLDDILFDDLIYGKNDC